MPLKLTNGTFKLLELPLAPGSTKRTYPGAHIMGQFHCIGDALGTAESTELSPIGQKFVATGGKDTAWCLGYAKVVLNENLTQ